MSDKTEDKYQNISDSNTNTPYDDVFRTLLVDCTRLIIPIINEVFGEHYTGKEMIIHHSDYHFIQDGRKKSVKIESDSNITLIGIDRKHYHFECQSNSDGTMVIRMFEYDSQIAIEHGKVDGNTFEVEFPHSAVLYLRHNKNTPDYYTIKIKAGIESISYNIPVLKVQQYETEELFKKKLYFLIPFHIFTYEKDFKQINDNAEKIKNLRKKYEQICEKLELEYNKGNISEYETNTIIDLSISVVKSIAKKYKTIRKEIGEYMGGKVLNYPTKELYNRAKEDGLRKGIQEGRKQGRKEGRKEGLKEGLKEGQQEGRSIEMSNIIEIIRKKLIKKMSIEDITELLEMDFKYVSQVANLIKENPQKSDLEIAKIICKENN